jgi:hypothetical protein
MINYVLSCISPRWTGEIIKIIITRRFPGALNNSYFFTTKSNILLFINKYSDCWESQPLFFRNEVLMKDAG